MEVRLNNREGKLYVDLSVLIEQALEVTELTADAAAAATTLTVSDIDGFAINQVLIIGELGNETAEVVKTHASTAPSGTTITLVTGGVEFAHAAGTKVYVVEFDQVEWNHAATVAGAKSVLATSNVQADEREQAYQETTQTSGFYFARFKNSISTTYSSYSPAVPYGGYGDTSVGSMISWALSRNGLKTYDDEVTREFCLEEINDALSELQGKLKRWPDYISENADLGNLSAGTPTITLPTDIYNTKTNQSILTLRVADGPNMTYYDPFEFEDKLKYGENRTQVATEASAADTTFVVDDARDFADDGSLDFYVSGTKYSITYTSVDRSTGTFSGVPASGTGSITVTVPVDTYVFQGANFGTPDSYTIRNGNIELEPIPDGTLHNRNIYGDYWTVATQVDDEGDTITNKWYTAVKYWLAWKVRMQKKNDGMLDVNDGFHLKWKERLADAIRTAPKNPKLHNRPFRQWGISE